MFYASAVAVVEVVGSEAIEKPNGAAAVPVNPGFTLGDAGADGPQMSKGMQITVKLLSGSDIELTVNLLELKSGQEQPCTFCI